MRLASAAVADAVAGRGAAAWAPLRAVAATGARAGAEGAEVLPTSEARSLRSVSRHDARLTLRAPARDASRADGYAAERRPSEGPP